MDRDEWFRRYYDDVILMNDNDKKRRTQALLKYQSLPEVTVSSYRASRNLGDWKEVPKERLYTSRKPIISSALADTLCDNLTIQGLLDQLNTVLGTSYTLGTAGVRSVLGDCILKEYDFGTAYSRLRPFWYGDLTTTVDDLSEREVQYQQMLEDVLVNDIIIYPYVPPRRVWDLYSNRVVLWCVARQRPWAISHAWMDKWFRKDVMTAINDHEWPVPIPKNTSLDKIRIEMLSLGAEYVWLDVLCLRQEGLGGPMEHLRAEEWKVDVPTIGSVYARADKVVCYLCGLGRPLNQEAYHSEDDRCWFKRAWTLQEISEHMVIGGDTGNENIRVKFKEKLSSLQKIHGQHRVYDVLSQMQNRESTNPVDKVAGMAYLLHSDSIPAYFGEKSEEDAWISLVDVTAHQCQWDLLFLYPKPGDGTKAWRPSWRQVMTEIPQGQHHSNLQIGCWNQDGKTDANAYYNGYIIELAFVRGLEFASKEFASITQFAKAFTQKFAGEFTNELIAERRIFERKIAGELVADELTAERLIADKFDKKFSERLTQVLTKEFGVKNFWSHYARSFTRSFAVSFARSSPNVPILGLSLRVLNALRYMAGQLVVKDDTGTECSFEITISHQHSIPDDSYTLLGTTDKSSGIHWVIGRRLLDGRLKKLSIAQMNVEAASMDSLVSRSIAKRASTTILA